MNFPYLLFVMFLYALIPCAPAVVLRVKSPLFAPKWISFFAMAFITLFFIIIALTGESFLEENSWISMFAQCGLTSSVPALFCVGLVGIKKEIWLSILPSLVYFSAFIVRYLKTNGFFETLGLFLLKGHRDSYFLGMTIYMSVLFLIWALFYIFVTHMVYIFVNRVKKIKLQNNRINNQQRS